MPALIEPAERVGERRAGRVEDGEVVEPGRAGRGRRAAFALPGVQPDVVMVAAGRDEGGARAVALDQLEAEHAAIEGERAVDVGDLEMDMADPGSGIDRRAEFSLGDAGFGGFVEHFRNLGAKPRSRQ